LRVRNSKVPGLFLNLNLAILKKRLADKNF